MKRIPLTGKYGKGTFAIVDDCDYEFLVAMGSWCFLQIRKSGVGYAIRRTPQKTILMHRVVAERAGLDMSHEIDHRNTDDPNNKLDNRRLNLRSATRQQNRWNQLRRSDNTSGITGMGFRKDIQKWEVRLTRGGKRHLSYHVTMNQAIATRNRLARELYGEFAVMCPEVVA